MIRIDGNGRDGGGRREDILLTYSPSFHFFLFLSFSFFFVIFFIFQRYFKISKEITRNKDMKGVVSRSFEESLQKIVKCNVRRDMYM